MRSLGFGASAGFLAISLACGGNDAPAAAPAGPAVDSATAGTITATVKFEGPPPSPEMITLTGDPKCVSENGAPQRARRADRRRREPVAAERLRLRQGRAGQFRLPDSVRAGRARSGQVPLHAARPRRARRTGAADSQQRSAAPQRAIERRHQPGLQQVDAARRRELQSHVRDEGSHGALQVRRPWLDERVRRRARSSLLRHDGAGRQGRARQSSPWHLHYRSLARSARHPDATSDYRAQKNPRMSASPSHADAAPGVDRAIAFARAATSSR